MKSRVLITIAMLTTFQVIFSQEDKTILIVENSKMISDSIQSSNLENKLIENEQNEATKN